MVDYPELTSSQVEALSILRDEGWAVDTVERTLDPFDLIVSAHSGNVVRSFLVSESGMRREWHGVDDEFGDGPAVRDA